MAFNVSALADYTAQNREPLIREAVLKPETAQYLTWQPGVKTTEKIHILKSAVDFQDGTNCGFSASGSSTFTDREIVTGAIKVNTSWCHMDMLNKFAQYEVTLEAGAEKLPFEQEVVNGILDAINKNLEKAIWQGNKAAANTDPNTNKFDGFMKVISGSSYVSGTYSTGSANYMYDALKSAYLAIPDTAYEQGDPMIFVGKDEYREFVQELVNKNLYHYDPANGDNAYMFPGTSVKVIAVNGLTGTGRIWAGTRENMFYGFDVEGAENEFKLWFSNDDDIFKLKVLFNAGVQVAFPENIVYFKRSDKAGL